jgi:Zn-dependent peptidase ImmA (M78 family)/transcriptional regulator with XRE-family HTH domain
MEPFSLQQVDPRVLGVQLQDARKAAMLTQKQVADKLGLARTTVVAIEKGERRVTAEELIALAHLYGRSVSHFVRMPVTQDEFLPQFRAIRGVNEQATALFTAAQELERMARNYVELEHLTGAPSIRNYPPPFDVDALTISIEQAAEDLATHERNRLGVGDGPIIALRARLENDVGLRVFCFPMASKIAGLFAYTESLGGCIGINLLHPRERRRWTLAHECGHFLATRFRADLNTLSGTHSRATTERFVDHFARYFLMPSSGLNRRVSEIARSKGGLSLAGICTLASSFEVSVQAMMLRLEELRRIKPGTWTSLQERGFRPNAARKHVGIAAEHQSEERYSSRYHSLALLAYEREQLTEGELAERLDRDRIETRKFVAEYRSRLFAENDEGFSEFQASLSEVLS